MSKPTLSESLIKGGLGFGVASLCVFTTVAFGERWMYAQLGNPGAYLAWTVLFILLGGSALGTLVAERWSLPKFYLLFGVAFLTYAMGWIVAYFTFRGFVGEALGSLVGSALMGATFAVGFGTSRSWMKLSAILFVANSIGYFLGSALNDTITGPAGMILWGIVYGLFLGAGIGAVLHVAQSEV